MPNAYAQPIDPSRTAALQPGQIWVPTPTGKVAMTLPEARQYQSTHQYGVTDPSNPNLSPDIKAKLQDPRVQALIQQGGTGIVQVGESKIHVEQGKPTGWETGGKWKPILLGAAIVGGAVAAPYLIPALTGGGGAAGGTAALGPTSAASMANTAAIAGGSTVPASLAAPGLAAAGGAGGAAAGTAAATLGPSTPESMAATQAVLHGSTVPASLSNAGVPGSSVLGGLGKVGNWLSTPGGGEALSVAGGLIGAGIQAHGQTKAAEIQAAYLREALAYEKQRDAYLQNLEAGRYADISHRLQPYQDMATTTGDRLAKLLGVNPASYTYGTPEGAASSSMPPAQPSPTAPTIPPGYDQRGPGTPGSYPTGVAVPRGATTPNPVPSQLVMVRAPTGETRQLDSQTAQLAVQKGATIVG